MYYPVEWTATTISRDIRRRADLSYDSGPQPRLQKHCAAGSPRGSSDGWGVADMLQTPSTVIEPFLLNLAIQQSKEEQRKMAFVESAHFFPVAVRKIESRRSTDSIYAVASHIRNWTHWTHCLLNLHGFNLGQGVDPQSSKSKPSIDLVELPRLAVNFKSMHKGWKGSNQRSQRSLFSDWDVLQRPKLHQADTYWNHIAHISNTLHSHWHHWHMIWQMVSSGSIAWIMGICFCSTPNVEDHRAEQCMSLAVEHTNMIK